MKSYITKDNAQYIIYEGSYGQELSVNLIDNLVEIRSINAVEEQSNIYLDSGNLNNLIKGLKQIKKLIK